MDPWYINGGIGNTTLVVENKFMYKHYIKNGRRKGIIVGGTPYLIGIKRNIEEVRKENIMAISLPPEYSDRWHMGEYKTYNAVLDDMAKAVGSWPGKVVVSIHPECPKQLVDKIRDKCRQMNINIRGNIMDWVHECNVLVTCGSSVMRWAYCMGITCINWNIYGFESSEYREFTTELRKLDGNVEEIYKATKENMPRKKIVENYNGTRFTKTIAKVLEQGLE